MRDRLRIERSLKRAGRQTGSPLYEKYQVLKERLFTQEYSHWATEFPGGNDHGPGHVERVLEKLDQLTDGCLRDGQLLRPYELFLTMMSILYHDIGLLRGRTGHADNSALLVGEEQNDYLVDSRDRDIISAAVMSHSSTKDIAEETARFGDEEILGGQTVRPRVIAALVRLADELDEDYRRADPIVQKRLALQDGSRFYWEFCQRINGIQADYSSHDIQVSVAFLVEDAGRLVTVNGRQTSFISAFGEKLAKINRERAKVNQFLPENLRYHHVTATVKPLPKHKTWKRPRIFVFDEYASGQDFVAAFPELLAEPATKWLHEALAAIRSGHLDQAATTLAQLENVATELPTELRSRYFYDSACLHSMNADAADSTDTQNHLLAVSLTQLLEWLRIVLDDTGLSGREDPFNAIHRMSRDSDLYGVLANRRSQIMKRIPNELRAAVLSTPPPRQDPGDSGCFPRGSMVHTAAGLVPIEDIREGVAISSVEHGKLINASVARIRTRRENRCVCINGRYLLTESQPVATHGRGFVNAHEVYPGNAVLTADLRYETVRTVSTVDGRFEVFALTTDHPSHNYIVDGIVCHNDKH